MRFLSGKDYPFHCDACKKVIDRCLEVVSMGPDTDDPEAPHMLAYDQQLFCGGHECVCMCSIGCTAITDTSADIFCSVHGGSPEEIQAFNEAQCRDLGHFFPLEQEGLCTRCRKIRGQADPITT